MRVTSAGGGVGWVVEDFGPQPDEGVVHLDAATTIRPRRYAIALDDGTLAFLDRTDVDAAGSD